MWLQEMRSEHEQLIAEFRASELRLVERMHKLEVNLTDRIGKVELKVAELDVRVAGAKADLIKWSFVFWVGAVAAIAMLAGVLK